MNCYNGEQFLQEAVESVLQQTYQNWELIFWDNRSTDRSPEIIGAYPDARIRYFLAEEHTPIGQARNLAIDQAKGKWLGFLDCDDIWLKNKLSQQVTLLKNDPSDRIGIVYGNTLKFGKDVEETELYGKREKWPEGDIFEALLVQGNFIPMVSALVLKEAFYDIGKIPSHYVQAEDYYVFVAVSTKYEARYLEQPCCKYRFHENNLTKVQKREMVDEGIAIINAFKHRTDKRSQKIINHKVIPGLLKLLRK